MTIIRGVTGYLKLGGQVVMRRLLFFPPATYAPDMTQLISVPEM